jgi:hypothetical protein
MRTRPSGPLAGLGRIGEYPCEKRGRSHGLLPTAPGIPRSGGCVCHVSARSRPSDPGVGGLPDHLVVLADQRPGRMRGGDHGNELQGPDRDERRYRRHAVSEFKVVSGKEIWATVAGDTSGTIHVTNASATASSPSDFTNANPGGCSPSITFVSPCGGGGGGLRGTVVTILGTNLLKSSGTAATAPLGGDFRFAPYTATATHTETPESPRLLSVVVPPDAIDGSIRVSTFNDVLGEGAVLTPSTFIVPPPDLSCSVIETSRSVTLRLTRSLVARGVVSADDEFTACAASVPVKIQRRVAGEWETVRTTTASPTGSYRRRIPDKAGRYRATAPTFPSGPGPTPCLRVISPVRTRS